MEQFYRVTVVDYSNFESTFDYDDEDQAVSFAEKEWDNGEGGQLAVKVDEITIPGEDYSEEEVTTIWENFVEDAFATAVKEEQ